jgi:nicotinate-nucleotide adenylyltransferase
MEKNGLLSHQQHIGVIGGTFDPIHYGHLVLAEEVRTILSLSKIIFVPAGQPFHKPDRVHTPIHHRLAMIELAIASNPYLAVSPVEIDSTKPSYLIDTLQTLHTQHRPDTDLSFIIGWDNLISFHCWYKPSGILAQLAYLIAAHRPGYRANLALIEQLETYLPGISQQLKIVLIPQLDISSTDLRKRISERRSIKYQLPEAVEHYIYAHRIYCERA